jgi:hypothetical protein
MNYFKWIQRSFSMIPLEEVADVIIMIIRESLSEATTHLMTHCLAAGADNQIKVLNK